jgi:hypothetical protein
MILYGLGEKILMDNWALAIKLTEALLNKYQVGLGSMFRLVVKTQQQLIVLIIFGHGEIIHMGN